MALEADIAAEEVSAEDPADEEFGTRETKKMQNTKFPNQAEIDEHNMKHLPYRSWCRRCVRGKGQGNAAFQYQGEPRHSRGAQGFLLPWR